jgi:pyruvate dehydrogenase E2 component (dihydrolipoamide acetyltransferase)
VTSSSETARGRSEVIEPSAGAQAAARRAAESKATVPHLYLEATIDMSEAVAPSGGSEDDPLGVAAVAIRACALALREHRKLNGSYADGKVELHSRVNISHPVPAGDAVAAPTVFDADTKDAAEIAAELRELASRASDGSITSPELAGGTFTVAALGGLGVRAFDAVITPPQVAVLALGEVRARPAVVDGSVVPRELMDATLACDARAVQGVEAAGFLAAVGQLLEAPDGLES